jgi:hypothetical protein
MEGKAVYHVFDNGPAELIGQLHISIPPIELNSNPLNHYPDFYQ